MSANTLVNFTNTCNEHIRYTDKIIFYQEMIRVAQKKNQEMIEKYAAADHHHKHHKRSSKLKYY